MSLAIRKRRHYYSHRQIDLGESYLRDCVLPLLDQSGLRRPDWEGALVLGSAALGLADRWSDFNGWIIFGPGEDSQRLAELVSGLECFDLNAKPCPGRRWRTPTFSRISWLDRREARSPWIYWQGRTADELGLSSVDEPVAGPDGTDPTDLWWLRFGRIVYDPQGALARLQDRLQSPNPAWKDRWVGHWLRSAEHSLQFAAIAAESGQLAEAWAWSGELAVSCFRAVVASRELLVPPAHCAYLQMADQGRIEGLEIAASVLGAPNIPELLTSGEALLQWARQKAGHPSAGHDAPAPAGEDETTSAEDLLASAYSSYISPYFPHAVKGALRSRSKAGSIMLRAAAIGLIGFASTIEDSDPDTAAAIMRRVERMAATAGSPAAVIWTQIEQAQGAVDICCERLVTMGLRHRWYVERLR